ncbi:bifunctional diaminohydroxyphosphoribosylaminopyrimidine deaminase/5-amino-6-(5-phosphoribosylamino)uracil reductase RibD [Rickettsiales endosymbiont of Stachyamoeba lipophora]|uniref:bifunctional diaminohydroxyphosphoribosylaminopyrimidine deaminase/5-amino-6-(5-phosphoribosylamino)uracil reductase RibD n=1 Tax=Rickettsiales endosymbiont of Stachyamoeba lipophora TaxID=2486578 RepID=UPI000F64B27C|nr:bifunctional diaminohydroxyphosphoribosylaminopyrimidine deaminase/5-amino-6-(5-phosphoribosylamino)uracil reductase RibD [Rickettsiales endosymbiont of Stachyamoeba lipophora]AZL16168.1 bifunctional diaminohydroxyphosphoribosylaminopyrimidine deaminase/5-amino-6-(5-phosphoribosylamino)uracil reductase RibD [Rickettsiales endosymbiont of Stachyamoeba lipophora]
MNTCLLANDEYWMNIALSFAKENIGLTGVNPSVGAVIIKDNQLLSYGITQPGGVPHAEIVAINKLTQDELKDATLYVTLEPCTHYGKSPPCINKILASNFERIVISTLDPNPLINGRSTELLNNNDIKFTVGVLENKAIEINQGFLKRIKTGAPFVTVKVAVSLDGKIATYKNHSHWLSNEYSLKFAHLLRFRSDAIMVGKNTYLIDKPKLSCRLPGINDKKLLKVTLDRNLKELYPSDDNLIVYTLAKSNQKNIISLNEENFLEDVLNDLGARGINNLLVEGGGKLITSLLKCNLIDKLILVTVPIIIGNDGIPMIENLQIDKINNSFRLKNIETFNLKGDNIQTFIIENKE